MNPMLLIPLGLLLVLVVLLSLRRVARGHTPRPSDLGALSARWLADLRRDDPWPGD